MVKKIFFFGLAIFFLSFPLFAQMSYSDIVRALRLTERRPEQRQELIRKISDFPSSEALSFLTQIIALEPQPQVADEARRSVRKIRKFLNQEDVLALTLRYKGKEYRLGKTLFEEEVQGQQWHGNAVGLARWFFLDKILDIELDLQASNRLPQTMYSSQGQGRRLPTRKELERQIEEKFQAVIRPYEKDESKREEVMSHLLSEISFSSFEKKYYSQAKIKNFLWSQWRDMTKEKLAKTYLHQAKGEVLRFLIEQRLGRMGNSRDDFGPGRVREKYRQFQEIHKAFVKRSSEIGLIPETLESFFKEHPALPLFVQPPRSRIQNIKFIFPALKEYHQKDPGHFEEAATIAASFYDEVLSQEFLEALKIECRSIFELKNESSSPSDAQTYTDQVEADIHRQKEFLARALLKFPGMTLEKLDTALDFYFKTIRDLLSQEKSHYYSPLEAFVAASEEAKGQYVVLDMPQEDVILLRDAVLAFMEFCDRILIEILKDRIFTHLELRKHQWEEAKEDFSYAAEITSSEEWLERGQGYEVPEIEFLSFYGKTPKKVGDQEVYYARHPLNPQLHVYRWLETQPERLLDFDSSRLQEALYAEKQEQIRPLLEQELLRKYLPYLELHGTFHFPLKLEDLGL